MAGLDEAREAKDALRQLLAGCDGVGGVGIAPVLDDSGQGVADGSTEAPVVRASAPDDEPAYVLRVQVTTEQAASAVPSEVHGVHVRVVVTGPIETQ